VRNLLSITYNLTLASEYFQLASCRQNPPLPFLSWYQVPEIVHWHWRGAYWQGQVSASSVWRCLWGTCNELILTRTIVLLPIKFMSLNGQRSSNTSRSCGDGPTNPSLDGKYVITNEAKWRVEASSSPRG